MQDFLQSLKIVLNQNGMMCPVDSPLVNFAPFHIFTILMILNATYNNRIIGKNNSRSMIVRILNICLCQAQQPRSHGD